MNSTEDPRRRPTDTDATGDAARTNSAAQPTPTEHCYQVDDRTVADLARLFKMLADTTRLQILLILSEQGETHVRAICDLLDQNQPAVSHHLALLRDAGLIDSRRSGKHNYYYVQHDRIRELIDDIFADTPGNDRTVRLADYVLKYHPARAGVPANHTTLVDSPCQPTPPRG
jgi:ArsR family transcriptional regulator